MTLTDQEISILQKLLSIQEEEHLEVLKYLKPFVPQYWALSDIDRKDDPEVAENFRKYNAILTSLRNIRINRELFASINTKLKQKRKENQRGGVNPWIVNTQTTDGAPLHANIEVVYNDGGTDSGWSNEWRISWNTTNEYHIAKYRVVK